MITSNIIVLNSLGVCTRAAADITLLALKSKSKLILENVTRGSTADCRSIMSVIMLAAAPRNELILTAEGEDEQIASDKILFLFNDHFVKQYNR